MKTILIPSTGSSHIVDVDREDEQYVYTTGSYTSDCFKINKQYIREVSIEEAKTMLRSGSWVNTISWAAPFKERYENVINGTPEYYLDPQFVHTTRNSK